MTSDGQRCILLRRPPVLSVVDEPFVPEGIDAIEIEDRWQRMQQGNPALFDGRMLHVLGIHRNGCGGVTINGVECAYRYYAVQNEDLDCGVRSLGVKGITLYQGRVLMGRRNQWVHQYPGLWEFAPGGGVEPGRTPEDVLRHELAEETGCLLHTPPVAVALLLDTVTRCWEIIFRLEVDSEALHPATDEYSHLQWCDPMNLPDPLSAVSESMRGLLGESGSARGLEN